MPQSERIIVPFEAKVKYEWSQYGGEINLSVAIPQGTRARDLIVVVQPFQMSVSLKGGEPTPPKDETKGGQPTTKGGRAGDKCLRAHTYCICNVKIRSKNNT